MLLIPQMLAAQLALGGSSAPPPSPTRLESISVAGPSGLRLPAVLGRFDVPANRQGPNSASIELAFIRLRGAGESPAPIVYLAGGPGAAGTSAIQGRHGAFFLELLAAGDLILFDQRGTGLSRPNLTCPEPFAYPADQPADSARMARAWCQFASRCADYWRGQGVDLTDYNTEASADDIESLCRALGVTRIRLVAASYGTHLALAVMRRHPGLVERAVLAGIEGPDQTLKLPRDLDAHLAQVSRLIARDPRVNRELPDFRSQLGSLVRRLERSPAHVTLTDSSGGKPGEIVITSFDVLSAAVDMLGRRATIARIPAIFGPAVGGDLVPLARLVQASRTTHVSAMGAAMDCASSASATRLAEIARQRDTAGPGSLADFPDPEWCPAWGVPALPDSFRAPVRSAIPTLLIAGTLDGHTPLANALEIKRTLPRGVLVTVEGGAHDSLVEPEAVRAILLRFLETGTARDTTVRLPPLTFEP